MKYEFNTERGEITLFDWRVEILRTIFDTTTINSYLKRPDSIGVGKRVEAILGVMDILMPSFKKVVILKYKYFLDDKAVTDIIGKENIHTIFRFASNYISVDKYTKNRDISKAIYHILQRASLVFRYAKMCNIQRYIVSNDPDVFLVTPPEPVDVIPDKDSRIPLGYGTQYTFKDIYNHNPIDFINTHAGIGVSTAIKFNNIMLGVSQKYNWFRKYGYEHVADFIDYAIIHTRFSEYTSSRLLNYYQSYDGDRR